LDHARATGNATSQAFLGFFHATGYRGVVPVDQAMAQLYYTFAAHGGDKGAQMTLGYRSWNGIGTVQDCDRAVEWYMEAAEQGTSLFYTIVSGILIIVYSSYRQVPVWPTGWAKPSSDTNTPF
jgi:TPR repeat protein